MVFVQACKIHPFEAVNKGGFLFGGDVAFLKAKAAAGDFFGVFPLVYRGAGSLGAAGYYLASFPVAAFA